MKQHRTHITMQHRQHQLHQVETELHKNNNDKPCIEPRYDRHQLSNQRGVGSQKNNSENPYFESSYDRQRSLRSKSDYYICSFLEEAIKSHRAVLFTKNRTDPICNYVEHLFSTKCYGEDVAVYHWDEIPYQGERIQNHLATNFDSTTSKNCYVFVRGTHVPLQHIRNILAAMTIKTTVIESRESGSSTRSHCAGD